MKEIGEDIEVIKNVQLLGCFTEDVVVQTKDQCEGKDDG